MNLDLDQLIEFLFSSYPKAPCSYNLHIDVETKLPVLLHILLTGAKKLYGEIRPQDITEKQFDTLNEYMESIGFTIKYNFTKNDDDQITEINVWFVPYIQPIFNNNCGLYIKY